MVYHSSERAQSTLQKQSNPRRIKIECVLTKDQNAPFSATLPATSNWGGLTHSRVRKASTQTMAKQASTRETPLAQWQKHIASLEQKPTQRAQTTLHGSRHCLVIAQRERRHCPPTKWSQSQTKPHPIQKERVSTQTPRTTKSAQKRKLPKG